MVSDTALKSGPQPEWQHTCEINIKLICDAVIAHHAIIDYKLFNHGFLEEATNHMNICL